MYRFTIITVCLIHSRNISNSKHKVRVNVCKQIECEKIENNTSDRTFTENNNATDRNRLPCRDPIPAHKSCSSTRVSSNAREIKSEKATNPGWAHGGGGRFSHSILWLKLHTALHLNVSKTKSERELIIMTWY